MGCDYKSLGEKNSGTTRSVIFGDSVGIYDGDLTAVSHIIIRKGSG